MTNFICAREHATDYLSNQVCVSLNEKTISETSQRQQITKALQNTSEDDDIKMMSSKDWRFKERHYSFFGWKQSKNKLNGPLEPEKARISVLKNIPKAITENTQCYNNMLKPAPQKQSHVTFFPTTLYAEWHLCGCEFRASYWQRIICVTFLPCLDRNEGGTGADFNEEWDLFTITNKQNKTGEPVKPGKSEGNVKVCFHNQN